MKKITIIDCSKKNDNDINKIVDFLGDNLKSQDIMFDKVKLKDLRIVKCTQCRCCTQKKGEAPIKCVLSDEMNYVLDEIESADSYIIISDTANILNNNEIYDKFSKRLIAYYYWPYGHKESIPRKVELCKKSVLINYNTSKVLKNASFNVSKEKMTNSSTAIGAEVIDSIMIKPSSNLIEKYKEELTNLISKL